MQSESSDRTAAIFDDYNEGFSVEDYTHLNCENGLKSHFNTIDIGLV
jgi:hypothetical protein